MATKYKAGEKKTQSSEKPGAGLGQQLADAVARSQAATKELEALSYSISHDLRAPLRSINAFSQLLQEDYPDKLDEQGKEYVRIIVESSNQLARMIESLLQLSRINRGDLRRESVNLSELAGAMIDGLSRSEPQRRVDVVIAPGLKANGDERLLRMALDHLLKNAWKFTSGKEHARIEFGSEEQEGARVFFVRDNGAGFDAAFAGKLFGAFQRLHAATEFPGQGIGLAMAQRIVSRHGGRIWADAAVEKGATFYFTIP